MESWLLLPTVITDSLWNLAVSLDLQAFTLLPFRGPQSFLLGPLPRVLGGRRRGRPAQDSWKGVSQA